MDESEDQTESETTLYRVVIEVVVKDFMSEKVGATRPSFQVNADTIADFLDCVWSEAQSHINRDIYYNFDVEEYEWANYDLNVDSLDRFAIFWIKHQKDQSTFLPFRIKHYKLGLRRKVKFDCVHSINFGFSIQQNNYRSDAGRSLVWKCFKEKIGLRASIQTNYPTGCYGSGWCSE